MGRLDGHVCIVTGAGSGLGAGIARRLAKEGASVVAADLNLEAARGVVDEIRAAGGTATAELCNVMDAASIDQMVSAAVQTYGKVDLLCNNVGASFEAKQILRIADLAEEQWDFLLNINLKSVFLVCKRVIPEMLRCGGGNIVNVASIAGHKPTFGAAYGASKYGVIGFTKALAVQYADDNIRCNAVAPGAMQTPSGGAAAKQGVFKNQSQHRARLLNDRFGTPDDIGAAVAFLMSEDASYITATTLEVDGGGLTIVTDIPKRDC